MRFVRFADAGGRQGLALRTEQGLRGFLEDDPGGPGRLEDRLGGGEAALEAYGRALAAGPAIDTDAIAWLPPLMRPGKILCVGLNYRDHTAEVAFEQPDYPTFFARFASTLVGHGADLVCPVDSEQFDFEGEIAAIIGKGGRHIREQDALDHVIGWSLFNDASVRDYQFRTPQWTVGKNFDATGAFGPELVTARELPPGARGMTLQTVLNGETVQSASTDDMVFGVAELIAIASRAMTLEPGDVLVTGTPSGVGMARKPPLWMRPGDVVEVRATGLGVLVNTVMKENAP